jgi:exopolyphosphatase/guanosine-5'-triphosphate,3'-diphosphate pyrophosphatase
MAERFAADPQQAERVGSSAVALLEQTAKDWNLDPAESGKFLHWAARLHESGLSLAHAAYQRHGAYLVANSDMPGFSVDDQALLAAIIRTHRRKIRFDSFATLASQTVDRALRLSVIFRIAVVLNRGRVEVPTPVASVSGSGRKLRLKFDPGWLEEHPLTAADLAEESDSLRGIDFRLSFGPAE